MIREQLLDALQAALDAAGLPAPTGGLELEPTRQREHGDFQTNAALKLAKPLARPPRDIANDIARALTDANPPHLDRVEVAGPGFVNLHLAPTWLHDVLREVVVAGPEYGRGDAWAGRRVNLEFVSANPTGPLHAGGGRWAAVGDALANVLAAQGADVHREYYLNDAGSQLDTFGRSILARYHQQPVPDDGYRGQYIDEMAGALRALHPDDVSLEDATEWAYAQILAELHTDLGRIGVQFDTWFSERTLHGSGAVDAVIEKFLADGVAEERDGAVWLKTSEHGDNRDRVLRRSDGKPTYLAADVAYHLDKLARGFDVLIDMWGADHHGQVVSLRAAMELASGRPDTPQVILGQLVNIVKHGGVVRLSKRAGNIVTLADILDEVDPDAARLTFLLQGLDTTQTFDVDLVTATTMDNPVYYVQYAHARIASIGRKAQERGLARLPIEGVDLGPLVHERELELMRALAAYPEVLAIAAETRAPHRVTTWVRELAGRFHGFYHDCRVMTDDAGLTQARLWLAEACRIGLADALGILGVGAPEAMASLADEAVETAAGDANDDGPADGAVRGEHHPHGDGP
jgi:arginyl-tRNA synthetase